jgi:1,4-alpha-glucan branching enzyme
MGMSPGTWTGYSEPGSRLRGDDVNTLTPVTFRFPGALVPAASRVALVGSFNGWSPDVHPLTRGPDGAWTITIYLPPGHVVYCFWVDGASWLDPDDDGRVSNAWGSEYSIRHVGAGVEPPQTASA